MTQVDRGNSAGFAYLQLSTVDNTGFWTGQGGASPAAGTVSHAYMTRNISTAGFSPRAQTTLAFEAGNAIAGQITFGSGLLEPFTMTSDALEGDLLALATGSNVDVTTNSLWSIYSPNPKRVTMPATGLILTTDFQSRESATNSNPFWLNIFIPIAQVRITFGGATYQGKNQTTFTVTPSPASKFPNGVAFGTNQNWTDNETDHFFIITDNPLAYTAAISDGAATTFITGYRPQTTVVTNGATNNWWATQGGAVALTSIVTTTGVATKPAAGTSGHKGGLLYETQFTAI